MNSSCATLLLSVMFLFACGCQQQEKEMPDVAVNVARAKFRHIKTSLNNGKTGVTNFFYVATEIAGVISAVSNADRRAELALELSQMLLAVDLKNQPYLSPRTNGVAFMQRERAAIVFYDYIFPVLGAMKDCGSSPNDRMEFFFNAILKYKDACFSVPVGWRRLPGESRETCSHRNNTAYTLWGDYQQRMSEIRRFMLPRLSVYLPPEFHDEFKRRIEPFFDFPSKEEFNKLMHPGSKHVPSLPLKQQEPNKTAREMNGETLTE